ncbi:MAG: hypothetical protein ACXVPD_01150 [Bacteroidia bacterium]
MRCFSLLLLLAALNSCSRPSAPVIVRLDTNDSLIIAPGKEIACKLTSKELRDRKEQVLAMLKKEVREKKELPNGYAFKFDGTDAVFSRLTSFIQSERACCNFFVFTLVVADEGSAIWMNIAGPEGTKEFIQTEMGL